MSDLSSTRVQNKFAKPCKVFFHQICQMNNGRDKGTISIKNNHIEINTAWKVFKYGVISGPYFPVFGLNTEIYSINLRIQSEYRKIRTRNNSVFGHFSLDALLLPWILRLNQIHKKNMHFPQCAQNIYFNRSGLVLFRTLD